MPEASVFDKIGLLRPSPRDGMPMISGPRPKKRTPKGWN